MSDAVVTVRASFDDEANVWFVESSDLHGVNAEATTLDALLAKLPDVIFDLLDEGTPRPPKRSRWRLSPTDAARCASGGPLEGIRRIKS